MKIPTRLHKIYEHMMYRCYNPKTELRPKYKLITYNGKTQSMKEWAKEFHINYHTLKTRIRKGWNIEKALKEKAA